MALSARERLKAAQAALINSTDDASSARAVVAALNTMSYGRPFSAAGNAVNNIAEFPIAVVKATGQIRAGGVKFAPSVNVTEDLTNYAEVSVYKRTAGGSATLVAQVTTKPTANSGTGNILRYAYTNVTVNTQVSSVTAGDALTAVITKYGAGGRALDGTLTPADLQVDVEEGD